MSKYKFTLAFSRFLSLLYGLNFQAKLRPMKSQYHISTTVIIAFILVYIFRFLTSQFMGIMPQDAYYYFYSEHMALSYFDHPPMVAYMLRIFTAILGKSVGVIKLANFTVTLLSFWSFYYLSNMFLSKKKAIYATILYGSTLLITILSINSTPDVPLILFWTISVIFIHKAVFENKLYHWILSGISIGLAFDSKYTALFLLVSLFTFLIISKKHRHFLFSIRLALTLLFFAITISPIVYWNIDNNWISFAFQTSERATDIGKLLFQPRYLFGNIGTQLVVLLPVLFVGIVFVLYKLARKMITTKSLLNDKTNFLLSFSIPLIGFFFAVSFFYWVKMNWIMPGYITMIILASVYLGKNILKYQVYTSLVISILLFVQITFTVVPIKSDGTWFGWPELAENVESIIETYPDDFIFSADGYKTSAVLNFYLDSTHVYAKNIVGGPGLQFQIIDSNLTHLIGKNAIFLDSDPRFKDVQKSNSIPEFLYDYFDTVTELDPIIIQGNKSVPQRKFLVYRCEGYRR